MFPLAHELMPFANNRKDSYESDVLEKGREH